MKAGVKVTLDILPGSPGTEERKSPSTASKFAIYYIYYGCIMNQNEKQIESEDVTECIWVFRHSGKCFSSLLVPLLH